ncbi:hypothetical protein GINT2_002315 [Glugoides intestinalis]
MTTTALIYDNIQKEISVCQKLILSNQPGGLLSTKSFIEISIAIYFIMTLLKEKEKEKEEKYYYKNLSNSCLTILLTIISGFISGKGLEILFRILHIWSGDYSNVGFSLNDIFISLLFGCIFVSFGYCLLFNKKLRELLRLKRSEKAEDTGLTAKIADKEPATMIETHTSEDAGLQTKGNAGFQSSENANERHETVIETQSSEKEELQTNGKAGFQSSENANERHETVIETHTSEDAGLQTKGNAGFQSSENANERHETVIETHTSEDAGLQTKGNAGFQSSENANERHETVIETQSSEKEELQETLEKVQNMLKELQKTMYNHNLFYKDTYIMDILKAKIANKALPIVDRLELMMNYLELKMVVDNPKVNVPKLEDIWIKIKKTVPELNEIYTKINETRYYCNKTVDNPKAAKVEYAELENKLKNIEDLMSNLNKNLFSSELNNASHNQIVKGLDGIVKEHRQYNEMLTNFKEAQKRS